MLQRFQEYGGELMQDVRVISADLTSRDAISMDLSDGERIYTKTLATTAGIAADIDGLLQKFPSRHPRGGAPIHPVRFYLGIEDRIVPEGMEDNLLFMREDDGGPLGIKSCYFALSPAGSDMAPEGDRSVTVTCLLSREVLQNMDPGLSGAVKNDLLQAMEAVIPFLKEGLKYFSSDVDPESHYRVSRALPSGIAAWSPGIVGRMAVTNKMRGKVVIINPTPWELGTEGEALAALAVAGSINKALGSES
jgi:hypothetical protein